MPSASAGKQLAFDVASVRQNKSDDPPNVNVPLTNSSFYPPNGGVLSGRAVPLINYIDFAYKLSEFQKRELLAHAPPWVATDRFNIEARTDLSPTKDQMRQMMKALLADRFKLVTHRETREVPTLGMVLMRFGATGPSLTLHRADDPACAKPESYCGAFGMVPPTTTGRRRILGRDVALQSFADELSGLGGLPRQVFDETGLTGTFDFSLEWTPEATEPSSADASESTFIEALKEQLGIRLESRRGPVEYVILDHIERPAEN